MVFIYMGALLPLTHINTWPMQSDTQSITAGQLMP